MKFDDIESFEVTEGFLPFLHLLTLHARLEKEHASKPVSLPGTGQEVHDDAPMRIADIIQLPEFKGAISAGMIRGAIARGELFCERLGRRIIVTPRALREWRNACRDQTRAPASGLNQPKTTRKPEKSGNGPSGSSETERSQSSLAALRLSANKLNKR